ncbi:maltotransferase domain-containing protein [Chelatococcus reniformis]|nr:maltotransferase domain-containing protein [Chelatococcus reniformis]
MNISSDIRPVGRDRAAASPSPGDRRATAVAACTPAGPRIYNLFPLLVGTVQAWRGELPRIAAMGFDWVYLNPFHQSGSSGSLYAIKDPRRLDARFRDADGADDDAQIARFVADAAGQSLKVMIDLVINHTARDALLTQELPHAFRRTADGELVSPFAVDPVDPSVRTEWTDLAELDYENEAARTDLLTYWKRYVAHMQGLGVTGFRCDAAYKVPAEVWAELIADAKTRDGAAVFAAETLGCTFDETRRIAAAGFDYLFNSFAWWDLREPWAIEQYQALRTLAPSIAFPENHDMARLASEHDPGDIAGIARYLKLRYALAGCFSTGVLMPIGYEWGYRRPLHVVETRPGDAETTGIDISAFIRAFNRLRPTVPALNTEGALVRLSAPDEPLLVLARYEGAHPLVAESVAIIVANPGGQEAHAGVGPLMSRVGGVFSRFTALRFAEPAAAAEAVDAAQQLVLAPGEVVVLSAAKPARSADAGEAPDGGGRVIIERVAPQVDGGATPVKRVVGEVVEVSADIFSDGHDKIAAEVLFRTAAEAEWRRAPMAFVDNDRWAGHFPVEENTRYLYTIEAWRDPFASWLWEVERKHGAGQDVRLETIEGVHMAEHAAAAAAAGGSADAPALTALLAELKRHADGAPAQLAALTDERNAALVARNAERAQLSTHPTLELIGDRLAARFSSWYELFPRSQSGDPGRHGTFRDVIGRLPYVRDMGFDVLYFPPIHPIGTSHRKGRNNSLTAVEGDVGSVYAIGSPDGGHDAVHPQLGSIEDFRALVAAAFDHGLEIALDFAIQCSPDHPWIKQHPEWFDWRPDGTLKYAENPPKKYEDIVNVDFYRAGLPSLWVALRDVVLFWCDQGVRIFRVDNPHTKPLPFWRWLIRSVNDRHPDAIFLAEAFTRPKMMRALAKAGFQQSYTYFTWRTGKQEIIDYIVELSTSEMAEYYRPNFFVNTPDINPFYLQTSGPAGFRVRAALGALLSSVWGVYSSFEMCEAEPLPGREEYLNSEKYEIKAWDLARPGHIRDFITRLNAIRRDNRALQDFRNVLFLNAWNDNILAFARITPERDDCVLVLINLDPHNRQECTYEVPLWQFGLPDDASIDAEDLLAGGSFTLYGKTHRIALEPDSRPVVVWRLKPPAAA